MRLSSVFNGLYKSMSSAYRTSLVPEDSGTLCLELDLRKWSSHKCEENKSYGHSRYKNPPQPTFLLVYTNMIWSHDLSYLGVTIQSDHIDLTTNRKAKRKLGFIYHNFHQALINNVYMSLVLPHLDYCCSVWDPSSKKHIESLEKVQRFAHKIMTKEFFFH